MWKHAARLRRRLRVIAASAVMASGCSHSSPDIHYLGDADKNYYKGHVTAIEYPAVVEPTPEAIRSTQEPHTLRMDARPDIRDISLCEAVHTALLNNEVIRSAGQFLSPNNQLLNSPNQTPSVFDPAIQETGVLFGGRGVEAALAAFDAQFNSSIVWGRNSQIQNSSFIGPTGFTQTSETANFQAALQKQFASGGLLSLSHNVNYLGTNLNSINPQAQAFPSVYTGNVALDYQLPLLAGAGAEFTRIAGPIAQSFGGLTGVSQGVLIARINNDIVIADFQNNVRNLAKDVEDAYWDLYLAYHIYDTAVIARNSAIGAWRLVETQRRFGAGDSSEESQARDQLYASRAAAEDAQSTIYTAETRVRELLGLSVNDGTILRPSDEPVSAELIPDWYVSLTEALTQRVELRSQKWNIKSLELQLMAAKSLTQPRLDLIAGGQVNGFGDHLLDYDDTPSSDFYGSLTQGDQTGWNVGLQMNVPIGFRSAHAQVRNYEFRIVKARKVLEAQELEIGHELAVAFQELARAHALVESNYFRILAADENVRLLEIRRTAGQDPIDLVLRAYQRRAEAQASYHSAIVAYNKSLTNLQYRKGTLLAYNNIHLLEGAWVPEAYDEAARRADERNHAFDNPLLGTAPPEFVSDVPVGTVEFVTPNAAARLSDSTLVPTPEPAPPADEDLPTPRQPEPMPTTPDPALPRP